MRVRSSNRESLKVSLPSEKEILLERVFHAPRRLVFEGLTRPEHVSRWWIAMDDLEMPVCEIDLRVGGKWRYVSRAADGGLIAFYGEYREIVPTERVVYTEYYEPFPLEETVCTVTLEERGDKTYFRCLVVHTTVEGRDAHIASGMEGGANLAFDCLEDIARELAAVESRRSPSAAASPPA